MDGVGIVGEVRFPFAGKGDDTGQSDALLLGMDDRSMVVADPDLSILPMLSPPGLLSTAGKLGELVDAGEVLYLRYTY